MFHQKIAYYLVTYFSVILLFANAAFADKAAVSIEAPAAVAKGSEVTVRLTITHSANSYFHYVEWVKVTMNDREIARWEYSRSQRPEAATFTKEIKFTVNETGEIKAGASCNIHGGQGPASKKILVKE